MSTPAERPSPEIRKLVEAFGYSAFHGKTDGTKEALLAALGALEEDKKRLQQQVDRLRAAGAWLSNAAFNLSQPEVSLTSESRQSLKRAQEYWDTALNAGGTE